MRLNESSLRSTVFIITLLILTLLPGCTVREEPDNEQGLVHLIDPELETPRWQWSDNPIEWSARLQTETNVFSVGFGNMIRNAFALDPTDPVSCSLFVKGEGSLEIFAAGLMAKTEAESRVVTISIDIGSEQGTISEVFNLPAVSSDSDPWIILRMPLKHIRGMAECTFRIISGQPSTDSEPSLVFIGSPVLIPKKQPSKPDVLLICFDSLRADELGVYGSAEALTPFIDRCSLKGTTFSSVVSSSSWTVPAMKNLLSGQYTYLRQAEMDEMRKASGFSGKLIQETLAKAGYYTAAIISNPVIKSRNDFRHGFDAFDIHPVEKWREGSDDLLLQSFHRMIRENPDRPLFTYIHIMDPHDPYISAKAKHHLSDPPDESAIRPIVKKRESGILNLNPYRTELLPLTDDEKSYLRAAYRAEIRQVDMLLQQFLLARSQTEGGLEDLLVIVTSDHGEEFGEHGYYQHGMSLFESSIRVPLIMIHPEHIQENRICKETVSTIDIPPTVCGLTRLPMEPFWDGVSLFQENIHSIRNRKILSAVRSADDLSILRRRWRCIYRDGKKILRSSAKQITAYNLETHPDETPVFQVSEFNEINPDTTDELWWRMAEELRLFSEEVVEKSHHQMGQQLTEQLKELGYVQQ